MTTESPPPARRVLLLSGGHDSIALAAWLRPDACLTIDYGQRPVAGQMRAARASAGALDLDWHALAVDLSAVGSGLLHSASDASGTAPWPVTSPSPEWWPFRNQLLASLAAAWALPRGFNEVVIGSVGPDGARHRDGTAAFYGLLDAVTAYQEGGIRIVAPGIGYTSAQLIELSGVPDSILAYAHSCHVASYPCGQCPGCFKHDEVLKTAQRLR